MAIANERPIVDLINPGPPAQTCSFNWECGTMEIRMGNAACTATFTTPQAQELSDALNSILAEEEVPCEFEITEGVEPNKMSRRCVFEPGRRILALELIGGASKSGAYIQFPATADGFANVELLADALYLYASGSLLGGLDVR
ncbi:hypothetical protein WME73_34520 [Sorangium sp. So ce302]|uniref:hypothetical protein n=1 Tax=unclassified Sorangium TaxID=2621164 RepID=UPI003F5F0F92